MLESGQNWQLFGYDTRNVGQHWRAAWRDLLWEAESPVRGLLDEPVRLCKEDQEVCYQAGRPVATTPTDCSAVLLPEALVLSRDLTLPEAVADDLASVLALEVPVHSPFAPTDTAYGWRVCQRQAGQLRVQLVIVSRSAVIGYLGKEYGIHDPQAREIWVATEGSPIVVAGFGEQLRNSLYRKRLIRCGMMIGALLSLILAMVGFAVLFKGMELREVQALADSVQEQSTEASELRTSLVNANATIASLNTILTGYPGTHRELSRLTALLDDSVFVERFEMTGTQINLTGQARDAASVMKRLTDQPAYASVEAPRAFSRVRGSDREQFHLKITLQPELVR